MNKQKICKEEKALIKAYVNLKFKQWGSIDNVDAESLEYDCTILIGNRYHDYRYTVEDYISKLINELNK